MSRHSFAHRRRSLRLNGYDYSRPGAYFVTISTFKGRNLFGEIHNREMFLNDAGRIVERTWLEIPDHFLIADLDSFIVMPNHIHGILVLIDVGRGRARSTCICLQVCRIPTERFGKPVPGSLPTIIRPFKSAATKRINDLRGIKRMVVWQRNYYEHVIRGNRSLNRIGKFIRENPIRWADDPENLVRKI